jgi:acyl-CoA hydrolase
MADSSTRPTSSTAADRGVSGVTDGKPTSAARSRLSRIMTVLDTNLLGTVHGGVVMKLVDDVAGVVAQRHSGGAAVTASMDEMDFVSPVRVGDLVHAEAQVNWSGRSSMEVGVRVLAEPWNEAGVQPARVATAYLVFVAVDEHGRPRPVPPVLPETDQDRRRFGEAEIRRTHRLARREAIQRSRDARPVAGADGSA